MKLLCIADIHLGRQPSRVPDEVRERTGGRSLGPAAAWERTVAQALSESVDALLIAGDVVEQEDDFYEAFADLRQGVERLVEAGIEVIGVTGNHDVRVLPRLAETVPGFHLLGTGGQWESTTVTDAGGRQVRVIGWSFPERTVRSSPLAEGLPEDGTLLTIGLLHCDRDQARSAYAPVRSAELAAAPVDAWLLGHIHRPDDLSGRRPTGYLGSITGLDPGEPGAHGPWLLEVRDGGELDMHQLPLAPLRWEELSIPTDGLATPGDIHLLVTEAVGRLHAGLADQTHRPRAVGCRLRFTGRTDLRAALVRTLTADDPRRTPHERDGILYFVHDWRVEALPAIDIGELAAGSDPVALLARRILILRGEPTAERRALLAEARERLADVPRRRQYASLGAEPPGDEEVAAILEAAALRALDELLAQRETAE